LPLVTRQLLEKIPALVASRKEVKVALSIQMNLFLEVDCVFFDFFLIRFLDSFVLFVFRADFSAHCPEPNTRKKGTTDQREK
jgi:hypothetical protein